MKILTINFEISILSISFDFKINVDDSYGIATRFIYFQISFTRCLSWRYGITIDKVGDVFHAWNTKVYLNLSYGRQFTLKRGGKFKTILIKDYKDGIFEN